MRTDRMLGAVLLVGVLTLAGGCATYVNIPAIRGDVARDDPNLQTVNQVSAAALDYLLVRYPGPDRVQVMLLAGADAASYREVLAQLPDQATAEPAEGARLLDVRAVRVRGWKAQADVVRVPQDDGPQALVTVYLRWHAAEGWRARSSRLWHMPVDEALRRSRMESETNFDGP